mmetsp:Transcript_33321/g.57043  ORF Transcript_33321/g.57043 Transcript_33321/m.57043 type:complete len:363 (+) Transcript_33321:298-1386(+)
MVLACVVVWRVHHVAVARTRCGVTLTVGVTAIVKTQLELARFSEITRNTQTPTYGILNRAPAIEGAIVLTVLGATIVPEERRRALHAAEAIADTIALTPVFLRAGLFVNVLDVRVVVLMDVAGLASMCAVLLVRVLVIITKSTRTGGVGAIIAVVTNIALTEPEVAGSVVGAVVNTVVQVIIPHVTERRGLPSVVKGLRLGLLVRQPTVHNDLLRGCVVDRTVAIAWQWHHILQACREVAASVVAISAAIPPRPLATWLRNEHTAVGAPKQPVDQAPARGLSHHAGAALVQGRIVGAIERVLEGLGVLHGSRGGARKQRSAIDWVSVNVITQLSSLARLVELLLENAVIRADLAVGPVVLLL